PQRDDRAGSEYANSARGTRAQNAIRPRRRDRAHVGRSRPEIGGHPRAYSPDGNQAPPEAAASEPEPPATSVSRRPLDSFCLETRKMPQGFPPRRGERRIARGGGGKTTHAWQQSL